MKSLSASEAIAPAISHTKATLFQPFRKGRSWKLAATAYFSRFGTMFIPFPLIYLLALPAARNAGSVAAVTLGIFVLLFTAIALVLFYLCSKLQFAFFDILLNRGQFVAPAWRKYHHQSLNWTIIKIAVGIAVTLVCAWPITAYVHRLVTLMQSAKPGQPPPPEVVASVFVGYGIVLLVFGSFYLVSSLCCDFILPTLALESAGLAEAFRRMFELARREPGQFALYVLLKLGLGLAAYMGAMIAWEIVLLLCLAIVAIVAGTIGFLLHLIGVPAVVLTGLAIFIAVVCYICFLGYGLLLTMGTVMTFLDAYTLYFLGGRYPLLGELLDRLEPEAATYTPPPGYPYQNLTPPPPPVTG